MSGKSPYFWEDVGQAGERLSGTFVLYGDEPVLVERVEPAGGDAIGVIRRFPSSRTSRISLSDKLFHRFRVLPPMGWFNSVAHKTAMYAERQPVRRVGHGLSDNNVHVGIVQEGRTTPVFRDYRYNETARDTGYAEACKDSFPPLKDVLSHIREGSTIAIDSKYAVNRDAAGMRWLYRNRERVGLFAGAASLILQEKMKYLKEELFESPRITVEDIKEF